MCETNGIDYSNLVMDGIGIGLDGFSFGTGGRYVNLINTIKFGYSLTEIGFDLFNLDFYNGTADWYDGLSAATDVIGIAVPVIPDVISIYYNWRHSTECVEPK